MKKQHNYHLGGEQLILLPPESDWLSPKSLPDQRRCRMIAADLECRDDGLANGHGPGWTTNEGHVCGVALAWRDDEGLHSAYYPTRHPDSPCFQESQLKRWFQDHRKVPFVYHNAHYDVGWIWRGFGVEMFQEVNDSACMAYMVDENRLNYSLSQLCAWRGLPQKNEAKLREAANCYKIDPKSEMWKLPARFVGTYAEQDAVCALLLAESLEPEIQEQGLEKAYRLEMDLVPMVHLMRRRGIRLDLNRCEELYDKFKRESELALADLSEKLKQTTVIDNIRSNSWLTKAFDDNGINYPMSATDKPSFEAKWMKNHEHWLPRLITQAKNREEMAEKFIRNYLVSYAVNGRLHPSINQYRGENPRDDDARGGGTRTYRFSYSDPPLQQIPHREEGASEIRSAFIAEEGEEWCSVDYSQQEYRLIVHYAALQKLPKANEALERYQKDPNTDFHQMVADMTGLARKPAKDANFAKAYGAGVRKFAMMTGKSQAEAERIMAQYDQKMPFVKMLYDECRHRAESRGYIILLDGARIHFDWWAPWRQFGSKLNVTHCRGEEARKLVEDPTKPEWYGKKLFRSGVAKALNSLIQGGAARQTKIAMREVYRAGYLPLLQIHDELCFSIPQRKDATRIAEIMRDAVPLIVPMKVDVDIGPSWWTG